MCSHKRGVLYTYPSILPSQHTYPTATTTTTKKPLADLNAACHNHPLLSLYIQYYTPNVEYSVIYIYLLMSHYPLKRNMQSHPTTSLTKILPMPYLPFGRCCPRNDPVGVAQVPGLFLGLGSRLPRALQRVAPVGIPLAVDAGHGVGGGHVAHLPLSELPTHAPKGGKEQTSGGRQTPR